MKIYLIRHGETTCNVGHLHQGWGPISLSERGFEQAKRAKETLGALDFDRIYCSDLLRARQTCEILFPDRFHRGDVYFDGRLREIDTGVFYGKSYEDLVGLPYFGKTYDQCRRDMDYGVLGGEDCRTIIARSADFLGSMAALAEAEPSLGRVAVVTHGVVIRCLIARVLRQPMDTKPGFLPFHIANCSVHVVEYTPPLKTGEKAPDAGAFFEGFNLVGLNYTGKLD